MQRLVVAHTGQLEPWTLEAARALLDAAFEGDMTDDDWEHCLGGMHALLWRDERLLGHAALVQRRLLHMGKTLRTGYLEGVAVVAEERRRGHASALMAALEDLGARSYQLMALAASDDGAPFYRSRGWKAWQGRTFELTAEGVVRTEEEDECIFVLPLTAPIDLEGDLTCDWREGDSW